MRILILNGPNLNLVGQREPEIYGDQSLEQAATRLDRQFAEHTLVWQQSNHEGQLIDWLQQARKDGFQGVVINPGGFSHSSIAMADAIRSIDLPVIEVHISNIHGREEVRQKTLTGAACRGVISGLGLAGYSLAVTALVEEGYELRRL
ncbi:MAG: type II 3-dehydroquinate dehydratase [Saprospiraceae bacterium]|nr:type II 3-dehydroquinate dehydratase [Saprospiraceae bacterium]